MREAAPPRFDPASYPGPRPAGPVLVRHGEVDALELGGPSPWPYLGSAASAVPAPLSYSVAYGSNACPQRLVDKALDDPGAVLLPARMRGWVPAFQARVTHYGSVPLTLIPDDDGRVRDTWVLGVGETSLETLDRTEGRLRRPDPLDPQRTVATAVSGGYVLGRIGPVAVAERYLLTDALAYLPTTGNRLLCGDDGPLTWPVHDQASARGALDGGAPTAAAPRAERVEQGDWPHTELEDLPLFVYGSLRPDGAAWRLVSDLVEVVGEAWATGRLHDTGHGWPAADLGAGGRVHGVLLEPRDARAAVELVEEVDAYEGAPELFSRRAVVVSTPTAGWTWAMAYGWADGRPPGPLVAGGRWSQPR
jgi:gamma-glutamylcyclotransferase (GGCT)/AIG2-like uncharacterized protein YtfP